jgi:hypothetical protein
VNVAPKGLHIMQGYGFLVMEKSKITRVIFGGMI